MSNFPIEIQTNNITGERTVSAREIYEFLGVGRDFTTWIKRRIEKYSFTENIDFSVVSIAPQNGGAKKGGQNKVDYILTLDMAKELCMIENNERGREARQYFIACEKQLFSIMRNQIENMQMMKTVYFPSWDLLKGSTECMNDISQMMNKDIENIKDSLGRIEDFKTHIFFYSKQATKMLQELENKISIIKTK